jgi:hypothetical protein
MLERLGWDGLTGSADVAIYYSRMTTLSRARGQSAVAAAAYRCGGRLEDARTGVVHDYHRKSGVLEATMLAPRHAAWALDLNRVWQRAEAADTRINSRTARELIVALPAEISTAEQSTLARALGQDLVDRYGVAVLVALHAPDRSGDERNVHVHLLMSTRVAEAQGFGAKTRVLDDKKAGPAEAEAIRERAAGLINSALGRAGLADTVDPRRLRVQAREAAERGDLAGVVKLARSPTKHQGRAATATARRGQPSPIVAENAAIVRDNGRVRAYGERRAARMTALIHARTFAAPEAVRPRATIAAGATKGLQSLQKLVPSPFMRDTRGRKQARVKAPAEHSSFHSIATGGDATVLNAQARVAQSAQRAAWRSARAYIAMLNRLAREQDDLLRSTDRTSAVSALELERMLALLRRPGVDLAPFAAATSAHRRWAAAAKEHEAARRQSAVAQHDVAKAHDRVAAVEAVKPPAWKPMTRRQWAEHRRTQWAALVEAQSAERRHRRSVDAVDIDGTQDAWRRAHAALVAQVNRETAGVVHCKESIADTTPDLRRTPPRPHPHPASGRSRKTQL